MKTVLSRTLGYLLLVGVCFSSACSTTHRSTDSGKKLTGETLVLVGNEPASLAYSPKSVVAVRSTYLEALPETVVYAEGRDYVVDLALGQLRRTANSRIPDFRTNMLHGVEDFDHSKFPGFGNGKFFVFVDYVAKKKTEWPVQSPQVELLPKTQGKLQRGESVKIVAFGDSITAGGDATKPSLIYWQRWADALKQKYPRATIEAVNGATGGDSTPQGISRLSEKVLSQKPDLVLLAFGMNDHNIGGFGTPLEAFSKNLKSIIDRIRKETGAEIVLVSTFPPNPKWHYGSHTMEAYAAATEKVARENRCAFADVYHNWQSLGSHKKPEDLLANNINHPNDFGHWMYFAVLQRMGL